MQHNKRHCDNIKKSAQSNQKPQKLLHMGCTWLTEESILKCEQKLYLLELYF